MLNTILALYNIRASKRLLSELQDLEQWESENTFILHANPIAFVGNSQPPARFNNTTTIQRFHRKDDMVIIGRVLPKSEPYCRASFLIAMTLSNEYPFKPPGVAILDPIYHPRVITPDKGCCCWDFLCPEGRWSVTTSLKDVVKAVIRVIDNIDSLNEHSHCVNNECDEEYRNNYQMFYEKALELTLSYGRPRD
jgi:ubiquitin-protein ligase